MSNVHVVALGGRTPVGLTAESSAAAIRARISRVQEHPFIVDLRGEPVRLGLDGRLDPGLLGPPRMVELAKSALHEVAGKLGEAWTSAPEIQLALDMPEPRAGFAQPQARTVASAVVAGRGLGRQVSLTATLGGRAGSFVALRSAVEAVRAGRRELAVVGGVDTYLDPDTLLELDASRQLAADTVRAGFPPGEAAAFVALASDQAVRRWRLPSLARVVGADAAVEAKRGRNGALNVGEALTRAIRGATADLSQKGEQVHGIYCGINGEREPTEEWGFAVLRTPNLWAQSPTAYRTAIAECGDVGAATGPLLLILAVQSGIREHARGHALAWACSNGGLRGAATLDRGSLDL